MRNLCPFCVFLILVFAACGVAAPDPHEPCGATSSGGGEGGGPDQAGTVKQDAGTLP